MQKKGKKKREKWIKFRHRVVRFILWWTLGIYTRLKYHVKVERFREQGKRQYLILTNHQTAFDQFFIGLSFSGSVYYMASEDIFSKGWVSSLIRWLIAPIPIKKQATDVKAVLTCLRVAKEGGTIAIAPEGNRTYGGRLCYINPSIAPLAHKLKLPIALYRIEGGYGVQPRWADTVRRGKMRAYVSRVLEPEEYASLSDEELYELIKSELAVDEACLSGRFRHKRTAEYLERAAYVCPDCGLSTFFSRERTVECTRCKKKIEYLETKELRGVGFDFPFRFFAHWYAYQEDFINSLDLSPYFDTPMYTEKTALSRVIPYKNKIGLESEVTVSLYGNRIELKGEMEYVFSFDEVSAIAVLGRNKLNIYHGAEIYQLKSDKRFNALKYVHIYHRYRNIKDGQNETSLGL